MDERIDIHIRDRINARIHRKVQAIGSAARKSHGQIELLKRSLNFNRLNLGLQNTGVGKLGAEMQKAALGADRLAISQSNVAKAAANAGIAEQKLANLRTQSANQSAIAQQKYRQEVAKTMAQQSARVNQASRSEQIIRREQLKTRRENELTNRSIARTKTESAAAAQSRIRDENRTATSIATNEQKIRRESNRTAAQIVTNAERMRAARARSAAAIAQSNTAVAASEQRLILLMDRVTLSETKLQRAGLGAAAAQNRLAAAQTRVGPPMQVTAIAATNLSAAEQKAAIAANKLAISNNRLLISNNQVKISANQLAISELRLAKANGTAAVSSTRLGQAVAALRTRFVGITRGAVAAGRAMLVFSRSIRAVRVASVGAAQTIRSFLSAFLLIGATGGIFRQLDAYRSLQNQLRITTESQRGLNTLTNELFGVANRARVPVDSLAKTFRRFDFAIKNLGGSQKESLRLTETVAKLLTLSGSTAEEASSSLLQLSQAFNKGKLDGDEFRSVAELMPQAIDEITKVLGISRGEIFKFSKEGKITVDVLRQAFSNLATQVDRDMSSLPRTIAQAWSQLTNAVTKFFGELNESFGFTDGIINFLDYIRNNLPTVVQWLRAFGAGLAVIAASGIMAILTPLLYFFISVPGQIALAAGYLSFFADQIKVGSTGIVTFRDVAYSFFRELPGLISSVFQATGVGNLFDSLFGDPQQVFSVLTGLFNSLKESAIQVISFGQAIYTTWKSLSWGDFGRLFLEGFINVGGQITTLLLTVIQSLIPPIVAAWDTIQQTIINGIANILNAFPDAAKWAFGIDAAAIQSIREAANAYRTDVKPALDFVQSAIDAVNQATLNMTPTTQRAADTFGTAWQTAYQNAQTAFDGFSQRVQQGALENARVRIEANGTAWQRIQLTAFQAMTQINQQWATVTQTMAQNQGASAQQMQQNWSTMFQSFYSIAQTVVSAISQILSQIGSQIASTAQNLLSLANNATGGVAGAAANALGSSGGGQLAGLALGGPIGGAIGGLAGTFLGSGGSDGLRQETAVIQEQAAATNDLSTSFDNAQSAAREWLGDRSLENRLSQYGLSVDQFKGGIDQVDPSLQKLSSSLGQTGTSLNQFGASSNNGASAALNLAGATGASSSGLSSQGSHASSAASGLDKYASSANNAAQASQHLASSGGQSLGSLNNSVGNFASNSQSALGSVFQNVQSSLSNFVRTGKFDFKELLRSIVDDMLKLVTSKLFNQFIQGVGGGGVGGAGGGLFGGGGLGGGLFGGSGGGLFGGGLLGGLLGFETGGYTGNGATNGVAGVVHGREYVVNAKATKKNRPLLEAMNRGGSVRAGGGGETKIEQRVTINNNAPVEVSSRQTDDGDIEIQIRQIANEEIRNKVPRLVASNVQNPNSRVSKALGSSTSAERRRG